LVGVQRTPTAAFGGPIERLFLFVVFMIVVSFVVKLRSSPFLRSSCETVFSAYSFALE
jgi:hypothetical protein